MSNGGFRRPERVVDITQQFVDHMPLGKSASDQWYDKARPWLAVIKWIPPWGKREEKTIFRVCIGAKERKALGRVEVTPYLVLKAKTVAEAIVEGEEEWAKITKAVEEYIEPPKRVPSKDPADLLQDRPPQEGEPKYEILMGVLMDAYEQAVNGKGNDRHAAGGVSFEDQDMMKIMDHSGVGFALGQAMKKIAEGRRLKGSSKRAEWLGAIVYLAGAIAWEDSK